MGKMKWHMLKNLQASLTYSGRYSNCFLFFFHEGSYLLLFNHVFQFSLQTIFKANILSFKMLKNGPQTSFNIIVVLRRCGVKLLAY